MNALEPFRLLGIQYEYLVASVVLFIVMHITLREITSFGPFIAMICAVTFGQVLQKSTQEKPGGWMQHAVLVWVTDPSRSRYWPGLAKMVEEEFQKRGVLPPSGVRSRYEA